MAARSTAIIVFVCFLGVLTLVQGQQNCVYCQGASTMSDCTGSARCNDHEVCFVEKVYDPQKKLDVYNAGCRTEPCCGAYSSACCDENTICRSCCVQDLCNNFDCLDNTTIPNQLRSPYTTACPVKSFTAAAIENGIPKNLGCLECNGASDISECVNTTVCSKQEMVCFVEKINIVEKNGNIRSIYNAGCRSAKVCKENKCTMNVQALTGSLNATRVYHHCCASHLCNYEGFDIKPTDAGHKMCLSCDDVSATSHCNKIDICSSNETCSISYLYPDLEKRLECIPTQVCAVGNLGRRSMHQTRIGEGEIVGTKCCDGPFCNNIDVLDSPKAQVLAVSTVPIVSACSSNEFLSYSNGVSTTATTDTTLPSATSLLSTTVKSTYATAKPTLKPVPTTIIPVPTTVKPVLTTVKPVPTTLKPAPTTVKLVSTSVKTVPTIKTTFVTPTVMVIPTLRPHSIQTTDGANQPTNSHTFKTPFAIPTVHPKSTYAHTFKTPFMIPTLPKRTTNAITKTKIFPTLPPTPAPPAAFSSTTPVPCSDMTGVNCVIMSEINVCGDLKLAAKYCKKFCGLCH